MGKIWENHGKIGETYWKHHVEIYSGVSKHGSSSLKFFEEHVMVGATFWEHQQSSWKKSVQRIPQKGSKNNSNWELESPFKPQSMEPNYIGTNSELTMGTMNQQFTWEYLGCVSNLGTLNPMRYHQFSLQKRTLWRSHLSRSLSLYSNIQHGHHVQFESDMWTIKTNSFKINQVPFLFRFNPSTKTGSFFPNKQHQQSLFQRSLPGVGLLFLTGLTEANNLKPGMELLKHLYSRNVYLANRCNLKTWKSHKITRLNYMESLNMFFFEK